MKITFQQAIERSATEFHLLRERAEDKTAFDRATASMRSERFVCDISSGTTRNRDGVQAQFVTYDWANDYEKHPHFVFYDFFRGFLLNKYNRILRGLNP